MITSWQQCWQFRVDKLQYCSQGTFLDQLRMTIWVWILPWCVLILIVRIKNCSCPSIMTVAEVANSWTLLNTALVLKVTVLKLAGSLFNNGASQNIQWWQMQYKQGVGLRKLAQAWHSGVYIFWETQTGHTSGVSQWSLAGWNLQLHLQSCVCSKSHSLGVETYHQDHAPWNLSWRAEHPIFWTTLRGHNSH